MLDNDLIDSLDTESRDVEIRFAFWLMMPALVCILLPATCLFVYARTTGYDESALVLRFLNEYHVALFLPLIMICATLAASLYLLIAKDVIRMMGNLRSNQLPQRLDSDNAPIMSEGTQRALAGFAATALVASATGLLLWNG